MIAFYAIACPNSPVPGSNPSSRKELRPLNGRAFKPSQETSAGDIVFLEIPPDKPAESQAQDLPLTILYEDEHLAILNKASGMVVHPAHGNPDGTVVNALLHRYGALSSIGGVARPGIVHRLDKETSGCLVVARNDHAHQHLSAQFSGREVDKIYLAVTHGTPAAPHRDDPNLHRPGSPSPVENGRAPRSGRQMGPHRL